MGLDFRGIGDGAWGVVTLKIKASPCKANYNHESLLYRGRLSPSLGREADLVRWLQEDL